MVSILCESGQTILSVRTCFSYSTSFLYSFHLRDQQSFPTSKHLEPEIFNVYLHQVELYISSQEWLSRKCQYQILQSGTFLVLVLFVASINTFSDTCHSVKPKSTWMLLKLHFESLVSTFVFLQLFFNEARKKLWEMDPVDYARISVGKPFLFPYFSFVFHS